MSMRSLWNVLAAPFRAARATHRQVQMENAFLATAEASGAEFIRGQGVQIVHDSIISHMGVTPMTELIRRQAVATMESAQQMIPRDFRWSPLLPPEMQVATRNDYEDRQLRSRSRRNYWRDFTLQHYSQTHADMGMSMDDYAELAMFEETEEPFTVKADENGKVKGLINTLYPELTVLGVTAIGPHLYIRFGGDTVIPFTKLIAIADHLMVDPRCIHVCPTQHREVMVRFDGFWIEDMTGEAPGKT